jgi:hypothetical protein
METRKCPELVTFFEVLHANLAIVIFLGTVTSTASFKSSGRQSIYRARLRASLLSLTVLSHHLEDRMQWHLSGCSIRPSNRDERSAIGSMNSVLTN